MIEELGLSPITHVVNSHAHNDHIRGNQVFAPEVRIVSTPRTAELIAEWEPEEIAAEREYAPARLAYYDSLYRAYEGDTTSREYLDILMWKPYFEVLSESHREITTRLPDMLIDSALSLDGPARRVRLIARGAGHTESDLVMHLPDDGILFSGDLVFNECHPYMADGSITGLLNWLDYLGTLNARTVVPGHGPVGTGSSIMAMKAYVQTVIEVADSMAIENMAAGDATAMEIPAAYRDWWFDRFYYSNLRFAIVEKGDDWGD
jgi:glyoxylase-like metal-dependent hydrolase (beta-lactamase superfamily II)